MKYDAIIIGAGMSGIGAGIRLAMFDKKVLILEKHSIPGGLNSYYQRRNFDKGGLRLFDVGLHALTNYIPKGTKGKPLTKLLKQLRISYDDLKLRTHSYSVISFPDKKLKFTNDFQDFKVEVKKNFPDHFAEFEELVRKVDEFNDLDLSHNYSSARKVLRETITNPDLIEMLMCPTLIYGSAWENDIDFTQFVTMFKGIFYEGFCRPEGGVRTLIKLMMDKFSSHGGEVKFKSGVTEIISENGKAMGVKVGETEYFAPLIFSSIGLPETYRLNNELKELVSPAVGQMTFVESLFVFDKKIPLSINDSTIIFHNDWEKYKFERSKGIFDPRSAVICFPDNFEPENREGEGTVRITYISNYQEWKKLSPEEYTQEKEKIAQSALALVKRYTAGFDGKLLFQDTFTPLTIEKFTSHIAGTIYGSTDKFRDGKTPVDSLYIIGTDQGYLGIVGAIMSGISLANLYGLMDANS